MAKNFIFKLNLINVHVKDLPINGQQHSHHDTTTQRRHSNDTS